MTEPYGETLDPVLPMVLNLFTFFIIAASVILIYSQRGSYFRPIRFFLITAYGLIGATAILDSDLVHYLRDMYGPAGFPYAPYVASIAVSMSLLGGLALATAAEIILRSPSLLFNRLGLDVRRKPNLPLTLYASLVFLLLAELWYFRPFTLELVERPYGLSMTPIFHEWYAASLSLLLVAFLAYPCRRMILHSRRMRSPLASRATLVMALSWGAMGFVMMFLNVYLRPLGVGVRTLGDLIHVALNIPVVYYFTRTTLLESVFEQPLSRKLPISRPQQFSERLRIAHEQLYGKKILLEFSPTSNYVETVRSFIEETVGILPALVVTTSNSPLRDALVKEPKARLFILTPTVSYPKEGSGSFEILIPDSGLFLVMEAVANSVKSNTSTPMSLVFDVLSHSILTAGFERTYSLLRRSIELTSAPNVAEIQLFNPTAHDAKIVSAVRTLFPVRITVKREVLRVMRA